MTDKMCEILENLRKRKPLVHCITNPISINQCANAILSVGARAIMAEHPKEVCEITETAEALMLNIGNITDARIKSIMLSVNTANKKGIPVLLDVVGITCSKLRRKYVYKLLRKFSFSVIKGNYSEITALEDEGYFSPGVDSEYSINQDDITKSATKLANKYNCVILATGKVDVIVDCKRVVYVKNGVVQLSRVTGCGCMLGSLCAAFMTTAPPMDSTISACSYFGICGELSKTDNSNGEFGVNLLDKISTLSKEEIRKYLNIEEG